jgi:hypothetical protein
LIPIIVPYTRLYTETVEAVPDAHFFEITDGDGYRLLLRRLWKAGEPFILVEHDVAPRREQLDALVACDHAWCHFGYVAGDWVPKFGCTRFGSEIIAGTQGVWDDESWPWGQLDARFAGAALSAGFLPHWHSPHVLHLRNAYVGTDGREQRIRYDDQTNLRFLQAEAETLRASLR